MFFGVCAALGFCTHMNVSFAEALETMASWSTDSAASVNPDMLNLLNAQNMLIKPTPPYKNDPHSIAVADVASFVDPSSLQACSWPDFCAEFCDHVPVDSVSAQATFAQIKEPF